MRMLVKVVAAVMFAFACGAWAQEPWPAKPIRMIVNFPPGGTVDIMGRSIAQRLSESLKQPVVVENRAGASGNIGAEAVARSPADGYTILMSNGATLTTNPHLYRTSFDPARELVPITQVARILSMLVVHPTVPVATAKEFLAYARANPGKLSYGSAGNGSGPHIMGALLDRLAGVTTTHVPYKGIAPAIADVVAGQTQFMFIDGGGYPHVKSGKLRMLAVATGTRVAMLPDTPTLIEEGVAGFQYESVHTLSAPAGVPRNVLAQLNGEVTRILRSPELTDRIRLAVAEVVANSLEESAASVRAEYQRTGKLIQEMGIRAD